MGQGQEDSSIRPLDSEEEIEGGYVAPFDEPSFNPTKHHALAAQKLAILFAVMLGSGLALHYLCFMTLAIMGKTDSVESLDRVFNGWLPALTGIVSSAATYYFTKEK